MRVRILLTCGILSCCGFAAEGGDRPTKPPISGDVKSVDFAKQVAPIFAKNCQSCHGPAKQRGGLRLDTAEGIAAGGDNGAIFESGKASASDLVKRIAHDGVDPKKFMPPKGPQLAAADIATIRNWIDQGAKSAAIVSVDSGLQKRHPHWAFNPPTAMSPPKVTQSRWVRNPIDAFVLAKLESQKIKPSPEADRSTQIRRLYLDLLGLPPKTVDVEMFVNDKSVDAYEKLVDRVLASPHFGERWGRHWLDLARYADSDGYEKDLARPFAWRFRNWVIDAINRDLPFDQFTIEQLAGDLLPNATVEQKVATGFHRNTLTNREGGIDPEEDRVKRCVDRVGTTSTVWLGLTMQCCQCHTHKYDPLTQKEFYGMYAFFNSGSEIDIPAPVESELKIYQKSKADFDSKKSAIEKALAAREPNLPAAMDEWETVVKAAGRTYGWSVLEPVSFMSAAGATITKLQDRSLLVSGDVPNKDVYTIVLPASLKRITAFRLEALTDWSLPENGPGRADNGNFVVTNFGVAIGPRDDPQKSKPIKFSTATADYSQPSFAVEAALGDKPTTGWAVAQGGGSTREPHAAVFTAAEDVPVGPTSVLTVTIKNLYGGKNVLGRFRLSIADVDRVNIPGILPERVLAIFRIAKEQRTSQQQTDLAKFYRTIDPEMARLGGQLTQLNRAMPQPPATRAQTLAENPTPPKTYIQIRGDFLRKGAEVAAHTPAVLPEIRSNSFASTDRAATVAAVPNRLDLSRWMFDPNHPLTSRVAVNHIWKNLFGRGIVVSVDDFGTRGEPPTHPELLDWLAREFIAKKWSRKAMIKLIVCSATYRQSSATRLELNEKDPKNFLLARQNRFRVESEITRDLFLAASGLLNPEIGGPSIRPKLPGDVKALGYGGVKWKESTGDEVYRRGMYIFFQRTVPYPMLMTFDTPDSNVCCGRRERSNTPLQALTLLNDPVFHECAVVFGKRIDREFGGTLDTKLHRAFATCLARQPSEFESQRLRQLYDRAVAAFLHDPKHARKLVGDDYGQQSSKGEVVRVAASIAVARAILNLDEFVTRE